MTDMRAGIRLQFDFMGKVSRKVMSINYSPDDGFLDSRIREFFEEEYRKGMVRYAEICERETKKQRKGK